MYTPTIHTNWPVQYQKFPLGVVQMNYHVQNRGLLVLKINASLNRREKYFNQMDEYFYFYSFLSSFETRNNIFRWNVEFRDATIVPVYYLHLSVCLPSMYPASTCIYYPLPYFSVRFRWIYRVRDDYSCYPWIDTNISRLYYFYLSDHFQWKKSNHVIRVKSMTRKRK